MQKKIIIQYYVLSTLFNAVGMQMVCSTYATFLAKHGLSLLQINLVNAICYVAVFTCEIPTGAFADIFGRKTSFVMACAVLSLGTFIYGCSNTFTGFAIAEIFAAIGMTFKNGAFDAWFVDSLKHFGHKGDNRHSFSRAELITQAGGIIGAITGSYMAAVDSRLPWLVSGALLALLSVASSLIMREDYFIRKAFSFKLGFASMRNVAVSSIRYGINDKNVRFILIITAIQIFAVQSMNMYWQIMFRDRGLKEQHLGFVVMGISSALALGAFVSSKLKAKQGEKSIILVSQVCAGAIIIVAALLPGLPLLTVSVLIHEIPRGAWNPMIKSYTHERIPSEERATISSFCSIAPHIGGAIGLVTSGLIAQSCGIACSWIVSGFCLIFGALIVARNSKGSE